MTALLLPAMLLLAQPPAKFESADGKFRVAFPGKPTETKRPVKPGSEVFIHITQFEDAAGARLVLWSEVKSKDGADKVLDGAAKALAQQGKPVSDRPTTFGPDKLAARDVVTDAPSGHRVRTLLFLANGRLYQIVASGSNEFVAGKDVEAFRDSFELLK